VPVDFSDTSRVALKHAKEEARLHGARLTGVHVIQHGLFPIGPEPGIQPMIDMLPDLEASRRKLLAKWLEDEVGPDVPVQVRVETGTPYQNVVDMAKREEVDLIVMGSHGHSGLAHLVLGSTAERVIRLAPCPVLVVKG
jgi:nucleotide-binding universal stress UspA family protein